MMSVSLPWRHLSWRARESGPQFILSYLMMLRRCRLPAEQIQRFQERRLRRIIRHALTQVPAYEQVSAAPGNGFRMLAKFPLLNRWSLLEHWQAHVARNSWLHRPKLVRTGGTTGKPVSVYLDARTRALWNMMVLQRRQWAGWRSGDRFVSFGILHTPPTYLRRPIDLRTPYVLDRARRELLLNAWALDDRRLREFAQMVADFRPQFVGGLASHVTLLARALDARHPGLRLRAVLTGGELLGDEQRRFLETTFTCRVYDWYNMYENVTTALQCERGQYHLVPELGYVEILLKDRPCRPGEVGEIVGTHLANYAMPLIRYNMNDLASPIGLPCPCGRNTNTIRLIGGRGRDIIVTPRGYVVLINRVISSKIDPPLRVEKMQFYQERKDEVVVRIVRGEGYTEDDTTRLTAELDLIFDGAVRIGWEFVDDIPRTPSGKYPYVVSHVPLEL